MAQHVIPHFHNTEGLARITIGSKEFQCVGAMPPLDHPHVFLDMGADEEIVCPYCSTLYVYDANLPDGAADPSSAIYNAEAA
ncbi:zinc-finger domain-containing protein [Pelagibacterium sediminicola]|uniref:zinc-finger domain-containing protein n=1 Tax=Pelagibacterium sediminicola TaxID=2248761 RepID=UPI000E3181A5|nr:zinc-finger domain-containing protein [Pelagibacterium sediminicola]